MCFFFLVSSNGLSKGGNGVVRKEGGGGGGHEKSFGEENAGSSGGGERDKSVTTATRQHTGTGLKERPQWLDECGRLERRNKPTGQGGKKNDHLGNR